MICIERLKTKTRPNNAELREELIEIAKNNELTRQIKIVLFHKSFPVDIRHNSKIFREKLAVWAEKQIRHEQ